MRRRGFLKLLGLLTVIPTALKALSSKPRLVTFSGVPVEYVESLEYPTWETTGTLSSTNSVEIEWIRVGGRHDVSTHVS